jgi:hypothetical protein
VAEPGGDVVKLAIEILAWFGALTLTTSAVLLLALWGAARDERRYTQRRLEAMERHPAGGSWLTGPNPLLDVLIRPGVDGWTPDRFPFRARPCRHLLYAPSLDEVEHLELLHAAHCPVARELSGRNAA